MASNIVSRARVMLAGAVQGVGFRPFVYRLARHEGLAGFVRNTTAGVMIEAEGPDDALHRFLARLPAEAPPRARIEQQRIEFVSPEGGSTFVVAESAVAGDGAGAVIMPDLATCRACLMECLDPADRRYRYAFNSCVDCGPRYSIIEALPYDRARTTMRRFPVCEACAAEYRDPGSRRFHAEPIACPACGPSLALWDSRGGVLATGDAALVFAADALRCGQVVAVKGIGGFQLLADASCEAVVARLRAGKQRPDKPFALMVVDLEAARALVRIGDVERRQLVSEEAPIVLLRRRPGIGEVARNVAPDSALLGVMLPYTPLHHLFMRAVRRPVVATSGNRRDEPIVIDEHEAVTRLAGLADMFLMHDRPIRHRVDDSVVRVMERRPVVLRRARGYAPRPVGAAPETEPVLALGGQQKSAVALIARGRLLLGPHLGNLADPGVQAALVAAGSELPRLFGIRPARVTHDAHPGYHSTALAPGFGVPTVAVPHHLAHVLACMADNGITAPVLGVAWDGTGYGSDGTVWGGEILAVETERFRRVATLRRFRLPGNEVAVREPRRAALGALYEADPALCFATTDQTLPHGFSESALMVLRRMLERGVNAPMTSSAGRLFDALASVLGLCQVTSFEGQAAMRVEYAADAARFFALLPSMRLIDGMGPMEVDWAPLLLATLAARRQGIPAEPLAAAWHERLAAAIVAVAMRLGITRVALTGGCFQNATLTRLAIRRLRAAGFQPFWHRHVPPNDGGLAVGQLIYAMRPLMEETT